MALGDKFTFAISLSVLDDLGRRLYRSSATVLGEAISNSWDANANNVWIHIDKTKKSFVIKDDGDGMVSGDFQNKFLKIGYSKRKGGQTHSPPPKKRPFIGRKGIGKLALLSCAKRISIISKVKGGDYIGGTIDNEGLDEAITDDLVPDEYPLGEVEMDKMSEYTQDHQKGTIIYFEEMNEGIGTSLSDIRKMLALYFRFSLIDKSFKIFLDDVPITLDDLGELAKNTEFLWQINAIRDPFTSKNLKFQKKNLVSDINLLEPKKRINSGMRIKGFIASVRKPTQLKISKTDERAGVDLFVNGRLREKDILSHIPTARVVESYLYGQIHFDELDDEKDRFATSREGIVADDDKFQVLLESLKAILKEIFQDWDAWRRKHHREGDPDNPAISRKERKAEELYNEVSKEYELPKGSSQTERKEKIEKWVNDLTEDARYSFSSYAECFISENLVRKQIKDAKITLSKEARNEIAEMKKREKENKDKGNVSIEIRRSPADTSYLSMDGLSNLVDKRDRAREASLSRDAAEYKPIRDALMHTALLTDPAKKKLSSVYENVKARVRKLLAEN